MNEEKLAKKLEFREGSMKFALEWLRISKPVRK